MHRLELLHLFVILPHDLVESSLVLVLLKHIALKLIELILFVLHLPELTLFPVALWPSKCSLSSLSAHLVLEVLSPVAFALSVLEALVPEIFEQIASRILIQTSNPCSQLYSVI